MTWLTIVFVTLSEFFAGNNVWVEMPSESVIACYHDQGYDYIGYYEAVLDNGNLILTVPGGGCDAAIAWDKGSVWFQWAPKYIEIDENGKARWRQSCDIFTLWSWK